MDFCNSMGKSDSLTTTFLASNSDQNAVKASLISGLERPILVMKPFACLKLESAPKFQTSSVGGLMKGRVTVVLAASVSYTHLTLPTNREV